MIPKEKSGKFQIARQALLSKNIAAKCHNGGEWQRLTCTVRLKPNELSQTKTCRPFIGRRWQQLSILQQCTGFILSVFPSDFYQIDF